MRRRFSLLVAGFVFAGCASEAGEEGMAENAASEEVAAASADAAAIEDVRAAYVQHYNLHHPSVVADLYGDSAVALVADGGVHQGKAAILAWLEGDMPATPTVDLTSIETRVFGDFAVGLGRYSVQATPPGGTPSTSAGHYMTLFNRSETGWKIEAVVTNFDSPPSPEFAWSTEEVEAPPEEGTMKALTDAWAQHFNLGHASVVAGYYEDDARVAFADGPLLNGKAEVEAALTETLSTGSPQVTIHDVYTLDLGDGHALDAGWYEMTINADGQSTQRSGTYMVLVRQQPDGSYKLQWQVANGQPAA